MMIAAIVLATINAPHSKQLDAQALVFCLKDPAAAKTVPGHMAAFFGEVSRPCRKSSHISSASAMRSSLLLQKPFPAMLVSIIRWQRDIFDIAAASVIIPLI
ncbi:hypothetical protein ACE10Z_35950 [Bradyrhizobium sp. Pha-3]|uniref:hypothetical protein n=1 Tax=Bradyrhizobium sp. Pha-3 TaxID=208375 RepID=UPI0035D3EC29